MSKPVVDVVDYGGGNIGSILRCLERLEIPFEMTRLPDGNRPVILPGVGAFASIMRNLNDNGTTEQLKKIIGNGTPYLGICIGMQILFEGSEEAPGVSGLGLVKGQVVKFKAIDAALKIPQIGWNWVEARKQAAPDGYVYFVNSYYPAPANDDCVLYEATYGQRFTAAIQKDNMTAFQFHPEKSGAFGQELIAEWYRHVA